MHKALGFIPSIAKQNKTKQNKMLTLHNWIWLASKEARQGKMQCIWYASRGQWLHSHQLLTVSPIHCTFSKSKILDTLLFFFFSGGTGFELRTLHWLGRCSTTWAMPPAIFALVIFKIGSLGFCPGQPQPPVLCFLPSMGKQVCTTTPAFFFSLVETGSCKHFY
jgi:hypothetical protein